MDIGWPSSLLKFDIYLGKELFWGVLKISETQNKSFVAHSEQPLFLIEAKHIDFQQTARANASQPMPRQEASTVRVVA